jgi:ribosome-binding ATPase YchF (GTP1/OBG family)
MMDTSEEELKSILGLTGKNVKVVPICAKLEADMVEMSNEEREMFLSEM